MLDKKNQGVIIREINDNDHDEGEEQNDINADAPEEEEDLDDIDPNHDALANYERMEERTGDFSMWSPTQETNEITYPNNSADTNMEEISGVSNIPRYLLPTPKLEDATTRSTNKRGKRKRED